MQSAIVSLTLTIAGGGFAVPLARPRILYPNTADFATAKANWQTRGNQSPAATDGWGNGLMYLFGSPVQQATALANVRAMLLQETWSGNTPAGWFLNWAYQGTLGNTQANVGAWANEMKPGSNGSDHYRWADSIPVIIDWCWNGFSAADQAKLLSGWTTTWQGSSNHNATVSVPSYLQIASQVSKQTWGGTVGIGQPGSNYFWGNFRNELMAALAFYYEDTTGATQTLLDNVLGTGTQSRLNLIKNAYASGALQGGWQPEGPEYGRYVLSYSCTPLWTCYRLGRDLSAECGFWRDALVNWLLSGSSPVPLLGDIGATYEQIFPFSDTENNAGFPALSLINGADRGGSFSYGDFLQVAKLLWSGQAAGQYAAKALSLWGTAVEAQYSFLDSVTVTALDWRTQGLPLDARFGGTAVLTRSAWGGAETLVLLQGRPPQPVTYSHSHDDLGSFQVMRGGRWLSKEGSGYSVSYACPAWQTTVAASPAPTASAFAVVGGPITASPWSNGAVVTFISGVLTGTTITLPAGGYSPATGVFTPASALPAAPAAGDMVNVCRTQTAVNGNASVNNLVPCTDAACHSGLYVGCCGPASGSYRISPGTTLWYDSQPAWLSAAYDLSGPYTGNDVYGHPQYCPKYVTSLVREFYFLRRLECLVILDRIQPAAWAGSSQFPAWPSAAATPSHWFLHTDSTLGPVTIDGPGQALATGGGQALRVLTLLPVAPLQAVVALNAFSGTKQTDLAWYGYRYQVQDSGAAQRYFLHVVQARAAADADVTASVADSSPGQPTAGTFTVSLSHPFNGSTTLFMPKGMSGTEATVTVSP